MAVALCGTAEEIQLTVGELGVGFDPPDAASRRSLGLTSMRERLELAKRQIAIESRYGDGTTIYASAPFTSQSESVRAVG